ncbi:MAG: hypothetical protein QOE01_402 [Actinomycetota bacterium]|jgi:hypothetical protein|nr:hypothetical protein [Actinomycetota bacterium]
MRLPIPGPGAVLDNALGAASAVQEAITAAIDLVPRATVAMTRVEALLDRMDIAVDLTEVVAAQAEVLVVRAGSAVDAAEVTLRRTAAVLDVAEITLRDAGRAVEGAMGLVDRTDAQLSAWEKPLRALAPAAQRFADSIDPDEVTAAIGLIDRMPVVLDHLENDVLPMMRQLDRVGPDLHEILEIVEDLRRVVTGLPGVGLLRKRSDKEPPPLEGGVHDDDNSRDRS